VATKEPKRFKKKRKKINKERDRSSGKNNRFREQTKKGMKLIKLDIVSTSPLIYIYLFMYMYVCMHVYTYLHTHTHTHMG
jgi:hypothetical protein